MKFIHLGDLHIGKNVNEFSMIEDQKYILEQIIQIIEQESIDAVLIAGDVYDRSIPSEEAVKVLDSFLTELSVRKKKVFMISGNHDSDERLNFGSQLLKANDIYIGSVYNGKIEHVDIEDEHGVIHVWLLPYIKASRVAHYYPKEDTKTYDAAFRTAIRKCEVKKEERNVILVHQFVAGKSEEIEWAGSESASVNVGTLDKISADCFDDFDYVAMGHIHSPQAVGRNTCRYSGSLLKYSLHQRELNSTKSVPVITMLEKGNIDVSLIPLKPLREIRRIKGELKHLIANAEDTQDYIYATLTDEEIQFDAMTRLREVYPHIMKMDYDNTSTRAIKENDMEIQTEGKSFEELVFDFYKLIHGIEPSEKEWDIIKEVAKEAGVIE